MAPQRSAARIHGLAVIPLPSPQRHHSASGIDRGVTLVRNTGSPHWRRWLGPEHRCLVPLTAFAGPGPLDLGAPCARELTALIERRGKPGMIVSDNGTELTSNAILRWCSEHRIEWHCIASRCPAGSCEA